MADETEFLRDKRQYKRGYARKSEIMDAVVRILGTPIQEKFTTKEIAAQIHVSEACIYRHFSGKTEIMLAVLRRSEELLIKTLRSAEAYPSVSMLDRVYIKLQFLLLFAWKNPGLTRVLTGEALVYEHPSLLEEKNKILLTIQESIKNSLILASINREAPENLDAIVWAQLMMDFVTAQWLKFSQEGFKENPAKTLERVAPILFSFKN